jgi:hypothetical protein
MPKPLPPEALAETVTFLAARGIHVVEPDDVLAVCAAVMAHTAALRGTAPQAITGITMAREVVRRYHRGLVAPDLPATQKKTRPPKAERQAKRQRADMGLYRPQPPGEVRHINPSTWAVEGKPRPPIPEPKRAPARREPTIQPEVLARVAAYLAANGTPVTDLPTLAGICAAIMAHMGATLPVPTSTRKRLAIVQQFHDARIAPMRQKQKKLKKQHRGGDELTKRFKAIMSDDA